MTLMTAHQRHAWRFFLLSIGISSAVVYGAAYVFPSDVAAVIVDALRNGPGNWLIERYIERFASYASPENGMVALLACWLCAPLLLMAGYRFTSDIVRASGPMPRKRSRLVVRALLGLALFGVFGFTTIVLAGVAPMRCRGCEAEPMFWMLAVSIVGTVLSGAMLGGAVTDVRAALDRN